MTNFGNEKFCMECCDKLTALQAWPFSKINVEQWLSNFDVADRKFALHMVSQFIYLNDQVVDAQFLSAFQNLSNLKLTGWAKFEDAKRSWNNFLNQCLIVPVQGEAPNPSDSGYTFARKARQILRIPEDQLVDLDEAIASMNAGGNQPLVFVDDFVGSGEQFTKTLARTSKRADITGKSISNLLLTRPNQPIYYCNVSMTEKGAGRIATDYPKVILSSGNLLGQDYSWVSDLGRMWPDDCRREGIAVIERYSKDIGYYDDNGSESDWRGFHCLGLGIAFEHSTPDASLPLFFSERSGWKPLVMRR